MPPRLASDERGATAVEFALVAPVLLVAVIGLFDLGYNIYTNSLLAGRDPARRRAIRPSKARTARAAEIDNGSTRAVRGMVHHAEPRVPAQGLRQLHRRRAARGLHRHRQGRHLQQRRAVRGRQRQRHLGRGPRPRRQGRRARRGALHRHGRPIRARSRCAAARASARTFTAVARTVLRNQPYGAQNIAPAVENCR